MRRSRMKASEGREGGDLQRAAMSEEEHVRASSPFTAARAMRHLVSWSKILAWLTLTAAGRVLGAILLASVGGAITLLIVGIVTLNQRDDLSVWHKTVLEEEFTAGCGDVTLADYLAREERLFVELQERIYEVAEEEGVGLLDRYRKGSPADPTGYSRNWNRTFELLPEGGALTCGVLLLHGMSDSPYSLRALGETLRREGAHVVGLRLPGHGTAPSGLVEFTREDMDEAVKLAARHLREAVGARPLHLVGYSNGGALAVHYALEALEDEALPRVDRIVLLSPSIGVTRAAGLAVWQGRLGHWLGLEKLAWNSIEPEYDPYKYNSFAVNAGDQVYRLTREIGRHLGRLGGTGGLEDMPPILAFQSAVDATVSTPALIEGLFSKLPGDGHELVLFDLNRVAVVEEFLRQDPREHLATLIRSSDKSFALTVVTNRDSSSFAVEIRHHSRESAAATVFNPELSWPDDLFSLSHVALPFAPEDPLYGGHPLTEAGEGGGYHLGGLSLRGENGVFHLSPAAQLRLRWNPFYPWLEGRVVSFLLSPSAH